MNRVLTRAVGVEDERRQEPGRAVPPPCLCGERTQRVVDELDVGVDEHRHGSCDLGQASVAGTAEADVVAERDRDRLTETGGHRKRFILGC